MSNSEWSQIRIRKELVDALKLVADADRRSVSAMASIIIEEYLKQQVREQEGIGV